MKQYAAWQAPFYSFWSKSFYQDVAKNWQGLAYGYLFAVICFTWIFMAIKKQMDIVYLAEHDCYSIVEQMPKITIDKGIVTIDKPSPLTLNNSNGAPIITFDTRDKPLSLTEAPGNFLVTKNAVYGNSHTTKEFENKDISAEKIQETEEKWDLSSIDHAVIDQKSARQFLSDFSKSIGLIVFIVAVPLAFAFCAIQTVFYALAGRLVCKINKVDLSYGALVRISAVALTPVLLIDSVIKVRGLEVSLWALWPIFAFVITLGYIVFAVSANIINQNNKRDIPDS